MSKMVFASAILAGMMIAGNADAGSYGCPSPCAPQRAGIPHDAVIFQPIYTAPTYYFQPMSCDNCYVVPRGNVYRPGRAMKRRTIYKY